MKYIIGKLTLFGLLAVPIMLLTGCQSDGTDAGPQKVRVEMQAYARTFGDVVQAASTRAWPPSDDFEVYDGKDAIRVAFMTTTGFAEDNNGVIADGSFVYSAGDENKWYSTFEVKNLGGPYFLYGYMPAVGNLSLPVPGDYANGATMTMTGLPSATTSDVCVIVGVSNSTSDIQMGKFNYTFSNGNNNVYLLCDHLYAALRLRIRVDATYHALRHINLKKVWIKDCKNGDNEPFTSKSRAVVTLIKTNGSSPIQEPITFEPDGSSTVTDMEQNPLYVSEFTDGLPLSTDYKPVQGYMAPLGMTEFTLVSQYDVYDTNGNLIRPDQKAENKIKIKDLFTNIVSLQRGTRYTLYLTVKPTYLYMLSEPDLDNPTVEVGS